MGFGHGWHLGESLEPEVWAGLEKDMESLAKALPLWAKGRIKARRARATGALSWFAGLCEEMASRNDNFIYPVDPAGFFVRIEIEGNGDMRSVPAMKFSGSRAGDVRSAITAVSIANRAGEEWARTNSLPHDKVVLALLGCVEDGAPGRIWITQTDGDEESWLAAVEWGSQVLGRVIPLPPGAPGAAARNAMVNAVKEGRELEQLVQGAKKSLGGARL